MCANFNFYAPVENVAETIINNYYSGVAPQEKAQDIEEAEVVEECQICPHPQQSGRSMRKPEPLFKDRNGVKDISLTMEMAEYFRNLLFSNKYGGEVVDTRKKNLVNRMFASAYHAWMKEGKVPKQPNGHACYRFLTEDCGLSISTDIKTYGEFIRNLIGEQP